MIEDDALPNFFDCCSKVGKVVIGFELQGHGVENCSIDYHIVERGGNVELVRNCCLLWEGFCSCWGHF